MPRQKTTISQLRVGVLVVATIAILIIFILGVSGGIPIFQHNAIYYTRFSAGGGLKKGERARFVGKQAGKGENVEFGGVPTSKGEKPTGNKKGVGGEKARCRHRAAPLAGLC